MKRKLYSFVTALSLIAAITPFNSFAADSNDISTLVAESPDFPNGELVYSDQYSFDLQTGQYWDWLIIYGFEADECDSWFYELLDYNYKYTYACELWYPTGPGKEIWSGRVFQTTHPSGVHILLFVTDELPYLFDTLEEANEHYGFDISPYIYPEIASDNRDDTVFDASDVTVGDVNGDNTIDAMDASEILKIYSEAQTSDADITDEQIAFADVDADGNINALDASLILGYYAHIQTGGNIPAEEFFDMK